MANSAADWSRQIRAQLKVLDPDISAEPITTERKMIDSVSEVMAGVDIDSTVLNYQFDIDKKAGADLDKFVALFGFARQGGRRATGTVTFSRTSPTSIDIPIPAGTQVIKPATRVTATIVFQTTANATMFAGTSSVDVPIECTVSGSAGNIPANTITTLSSIGGSEISTVSNAAATTGGTDQDSDAELRTRFKNTIFRNLSGTYHQYLALAIASRFANKAKVIGPVDRFIEYVQVPAGFVITSQIPYSKYTYNFDYYLTNGDITNEIFYSKNGVQFTFSNAVPPTVTINDTTTLPVNTILLLEHSYCSVNSRNDPASSVLNYIDVYISGQDDTSATEATAFPTTANNFNTTGGSPYNIANYQRAKTNAAPIVGNRFMDLLWQPATIAPDSIVVNGSTYLEGHDYWLVKDVTNYKGSRRARNGIEWSAATCALITAGTEFTITYTFDKLPLAINELMDSHKQVTADVLVHSAVERFFNINVIVMYTPGYAKSSVDIALASALTDYLEKEDFGAVIQISDLIEISHEVPGVDNIRLANSSDGVAYGIQEVAADGVTPLGAPYTNDFSLSDSDLPVLNQVIATQRSQNTWS